MRVQQTYQKLNTNLKWIIWFIVFNLIAISWVLIIWLFHIESYPNLPFLYKGIQQLPIQFLQISLYMIAIAIIYLLAEHKLTTHLRPIKILLIVLIVLCFIMAFFYSANVFSITNSLMQIWLFNEVKSVTSSKE